MAVRTNPVTAPMTASHPATSIVTCLEWSCVSRSPWGCERTIESAASRKTTSPTRAALQAKNSSQCTNGPTGVNIPPVYARITEATRVSAPYRPSGGNRPHAPKRRLAETLLGEDGRLAAFRGMACSNSAATYSSRSSPPIGATNCTPIGSPSRLAPQRQADGWVPMHIQRRRERAVAEMLAQPGPDVALGAAGPA